MTNKQTMQAFINQVKEKGNNSTKSIFFEGNIVYSYGYHYPLGYSYGYHYPLGILINNTLVVNGESYSNSTSKHRNDLLSSFGYGDYIDAPTEAMQELRKENIKEFKELAIAYHNDLINKAMKKLERARTDNSKEFYKREIEESEQQIGLITNLKGATND